LKYYIKITFGFIRSRDKRVQNKGWAPPVPRAMVVNVKNYSMDHSLHLNRC